jgi:hypothetical protein
MGSHKRDFGERALCVLGVIVFDVFCDGSSWYETWHYGLHIFRILESFGPDCTIKGI